MNPTGYLTIGKVYLPMDTDETFGEWLQSEMNEKGWSQSVLANKSGITPAQIGRLINGTRQPGQDSLKGIAKALGISVLTVYRHAGILPPSTDDDASWEDWKVILRELTDDQREELWGMAEVMRDRKQKREAAKRRSRKTAEASS